MFQVIVGGIVVFGLLAWFLTWWFADTHENQTILRRVNENAAWQSKAMRAVAKGRQPDTQPAHRSASRPKRSRFTKTLAPDRMVDWISGEDDWETLLNNTLAWANGNMVGADNRLGTDRIWAAASAKLRELNAQKHTPWYITSAIAWWDIDARRLGSPGPTPDWFLLFDETWEIPGFNQELTCRDAHSLAASIGLQTKYG